MSEANISSVISDLVSNFGSIHLPTLAVGSACILIILIFKKWKPSVPGELISVILDIFAVWYFRLETFGIDIVGNVQKGYPAPEFPSLGTLYYWQIMPIVLAISFLGFTQSIALAKTMVRRNPDYKVDSNQELFSIGLANMAGSIFNAILLPAVFPGLL